VVTTQVHELATYVFDEARFAGRQGEKGFQHIRCRPCPSLKLATGATQQPDLALFDESPSLSAFAKRYPTILWEVAYTQSSAYVAEKSARWITQSCCRVRLVIVIDIIVGKKPSLTLELEGKEDKDKNDDKDDKDKEDKEDKEDDKDDKDEDDNEDGKYWISKSIPREIRASEIREIWCHFWEPDPPKKLTQPAKAQNIGVLVRTDADGVLERQGRTAPPVRSYSYIQLIDNKYVQFSARVTKTVKVGSIFLLGANNPSFAHPCPGLPISFQTQACPSTNSSPSTSLISPASSRNDWPGGLQYLPQRHFGGGFCSF
jgi:hypothetical protein